MKLIWFALWMLAQMNTLQDKPIVHLHPEQDTIPFEFGGDTVELMHAPAMVQLPSVPPQLDSAGKPWVIELRNLGPGVVTIVGRAQFRLRLPVGKSANIKAAQGGYVVLP